MCFGYLLLVFAKLLTLAAAIPEAGTNVLDRIEELITQWAPLVWLAPQENFFPLNIEEFLKNVYVDIQGNGSKKSTDSFAELPFGLGSEKFYLVTKTNIDTLLKDRSSFIHGKDPNHHKVPVYTLVTPCSPNLSFRVSDADSLANTISGIYGETDRHPHFYVVFWMFYPYNRGKEICFLGKVPTPSFFGSCIGNPKVIGNHVGDWEHVTLSFAGKPYPDKMYLSVHDAGVYYKYDPASRLFKYEKQVTRKGILQRPKFPPIVRNQRGHPVLFSAYGSHGMWSAPGEHYYVRVPRLIDKNGYGTAWETWKQLEIFYLGTSKLPLWVMYKGKWGNPQRNCFLMKKLGICEISDGPRGILDRIQDFSCTREVT